MKLLVFRLLHAIICAAVVALAAQAPDPARSALEGAYEALRAKDYDAAVARFREALDLASGRAGVRKDLAYTYLKTGETEAARDQFGEAMRLDPEDSHVALEYAFLCYETGRRAEARRTFDRVRRTAKDPAVRGAAETAFQNVDQPLEASIRRWSDAVAASPGNFSAHRELAAAAEERGELETAARHYWKAWSLRPAEHSLLLDLARVWRALGKNEQADSALLQAASGPEPRVAEAARELLPRGLEQTRQALLFDAKPASTGAAAVAPSRLSAKEMADRSYEAGYLKDALRYLKMANESDPTDFEVMLKMGWTYNGLRQDDQAIRWFGMARKSPDATVAAEAGKAYRNLQPALARFRTTAWAFPFYSSRWKDVFSYVQVKTEMRVPRLPVRPYLSMRFIGDTRSTSAQVLPQYFSETAFVFGLGLASAPWHGATFWGEAGTAVSYLGRRADSGRAKPDYRGGVAYGKSFGPQLGTEASGLFVETSEDGVFLSRFQNDFLVYSQNRLGYSLPALGLLEAQIYCNSNLTFDVSGQYWANFFETGPGFRFRFQGLPPALSFSVDLLRGAYMRGEAREPRYTDFRAGLWYAITR